jgi:uncharacterized membrane protein
MSPSTSRHDAEALVDRPLAVRLTTFEARALSQQRRCTTPSVCVSALTIVKCITFPATRTAEQIASRAPSLTDPRNQQIGQQIQRLHQQC